MFKKIIQHQRQATDLAALKQPRASKFAINHLKQSKFSGFIRMSSAAPDSVSSQQKLESMIETLKELPLNM